MSYAFWSPTTVYNNGDLVEGSNGEVYQSIADGNLNKDPTDPNISFLWWNLAETLGVNSINKQKGNLIFQGQNGLTISVKGKIFDFSVSNPTGVASLNGQSGNVSIISSSGNVSVVAANNEINLNANLAGLVPYSGANQLVNLGSQSIVSSGNGVFNKLRLTNSIQVAQPGSGGQYDNPIVFVPTININSGNGQVIVLNFAGSQFPAGRWLVMYNTGEGNSGNVVVNWNGTILSIVSGQFTGGSAGTIAQSTSNQDTLVYNYSSHAAGGVGNAIAFNLEVVS